MKKLPIIIYSVLGVGLCAALALLFVNMGDLGSAKDEIAEKESIISSLETTKSGLEADLSSAEAEIDDLKTQLADEKAQCQLLTGEVNDLTTQKLAIDSQLATAKSNYSTAQTLNTTLTNDLKTVTDPRHFSSVTELTDWLQQDTTDEEYADLRDSSYLQMCYILQVRALRDGYILPAYIVPLSSVATWTSNIACIGDTFYLVEPGDDSVEQYFIYEGVPSHPEPLP